MTNFIPIFPLEIVVFPGEMVNLHIFEPRYKQMITECLEQKKPFGIPSVINKKLSETGTLVEIAEMVKKYDSGEFDIKTRGLKVFRILEVIKSIPDKLYSGSIVNYPRNTHGSGNRKLMNQVLERLKDLHQMLNLSPAFTKPEEELNAYDIAHHAGLSLEEEYELLGLMTEIQRQEYLRRHLTKVIPVLREMDHLRQKVKLNGHFKNLSALDLDL